MTDNHNPTHMSHGGGVVLPPEPTRQDRLVTDADLVERAVRNAGHNGEMKPRWVAVKSTFAVGSTTAQDLCYRFGLSPDEQVGVEGRYLVDVGDLDNDCDGEPDDNQDHDAQARALTDEDFAAALGQARNGPRSEWTDALEREAMYRQPAEDALDGQQALDWRVGVVVTEGT